MRTAAACIVLVLVLAADGTRAAGGDDAQPQQVLADAGAALLAEFDAFLEAPPAYRRRVLTECRTFPEGDLFPFTFPAMAYANLAVEGRLERPRAQEQIAKLIELAIPSSVERLRPLGGKLERLTSYKDNAVYTGQINLAIGCYRLVGGDERYEILHEHLSELLHTELVRLKGRPLMSLPKLRWPFDTIPVLVSLRLRDRATGTDRYSEAIRTQLAWARQEGTDRRTGLPWTRMTGAVREGPRGCDISWRIMLLAQLDRPYAGRMYRNYVRWFWLQRPPLVGFAEWPEGKTVYQDADSGPIVDGIGMAATGFGYGAAMAGGDSDRLDRLCLQLPHTRGILMAARQDRSSFARVIHIDPRYYTGFLFGDACLFDSLTWTDWGLAGVK